MVLSATLAVFGSGKSNLSAEGTTANFAKISLKIPSPSSVPAPIPALLNSINPIGKWCLQEKYNNGVCPAGGCTFTPSSSYTFSKKAPVPTVNGGYYTVDQCIGQAKLAGITSGYIGLQVNGKVCYYSQSAPTQYTGSAVPLSSSAGTCGGACTNSGGLYCGSSATTAGKPSYIAVYSF